MKHSKSRAKSTKKKRTARRTTKTSNSTFRMQHLEHIEMVLKTVLLKINCGRYKKRNDLKLEDTPEETPLLKWLNQDTKDPLGLDKTGFRNRLIPQLMALLRHCMLHHRWTDALQVLQGLCRETRGTNLTIWRCGLEILYQLPCSNTDKLIDNFIRQVKILFDVNSHQVVMENVFHLLIQGHLEDAMFAIQTAPQKKTKHEEKTSEELLKAYTGLISYVEWIDEKSKLDGLRQEAEESSYVLVSSQIVLCEDIMHKAAETAVKCFEHLSNIDGVWDIFIMKHVELLEYLGEPAKAKEIQKKYEEKNDVSLFDE